jgi:AraC family transcriptional regulator
MTNREVILKSINFIEDNLKNDIDVLTVSQEVCYSLYHFARLFQHVTGYSPKHYIQQRRLTEALNSLKSSKDKIADIAYEYQYGSPEAFTRAFRSQFNIKPSSVRQGVSLTSLNTVPRINKEYIYQSDSARNIPPELVAIQERSLVGIAFFKTMEELKDLTPEWMQFMSEVKTIKHQIHPQRLYQLNYWSDKQEINGMYFFLGTEVSKLEDIAPFFVIKTIPAGKYLKFIHKGLANKVGYTYKYIYNQYLPETEYKLTQPFDFEYYGEKCLGPYNENSESEVYIPVK